MQFFLVSNFFFSIVFKNSYQELFYIRGVLRNKTKVIEKYLWKSLFLVKLYIGFFFFFFFTWKINRKAIFRTIFFSRIPPIRLISALCKCSRIKELHKLFSKYVFFLEIYFAPYCNTFVIHSPQIIGTKTLSQSIERLWESFIQSKTLTESNFNCSIEGHSLNTIT